MTTSAIQADATPARDLVLEVTPPRTPRNLLARERLRAGAPALHRAPLILVQAPAGTGKTTLLTQWRLEHLAEGAIVAWLLAQPLDDPQRFVRALALSVRVGAARSTFGHTLLQDGAPDPLEAASVWLAEVAHLGLEVVLIVDEAGRLGQASRETLVYLVRNAPPNLRVVIAARPGVQFDLGDAIDRGECVVVAASTLRFTLEESMALARQRLGARFDADAAARLHELTEGWPLGLQLALGAAQSDPRGPIELPAPPVRHDMLRGQIERLLLANLDRLDLEFLTLASILEFMHPQLCSALAGAPDAAERLDRLTRDTPLLSAGESGAWLRMHALAREALRERFCALPAAEQAAAHERASNWLAAQGMFESAARHALAAGRRESACDLAERSVYDAVMAGGRQWVVLDWLRQLPDDALDSRPRLLLVAAWTLATSGRHAEAAALVARILARQGDDRAWQFECALISGAAAVFADDPDRFAQLHDPWAVDPPLRDPMLVQMHANRSALRALLDGDPALARTRRQQAPLPPDPASVAYLLHWGEFFCGLSYLWEGQVRLAEERLGSTLAQVEANLGRRNPFVCMVAALLAAAVWERDRPDDAVALLANRLDILERNGLPDVVIHAFRTLARNAVAAGLEHLAIELYGALHAAGRTRGCTRLCVASLAGQVQMHARRFRGETCRSLCAQIDAVLAEPGCPQGPLWQRSVTLLRDAALGYAAIAAQDWRGAIDPLGRAEALARQTRQDGLRVELLGLRAFALDRCGERVLPLIREAMGLAQTYGLERVFADAHPGLDDWVRRVAEDDGARSGAPAAMARPSAAAAPARLHATPSLALTPREREVLALLARHLSNKEIGRAMQVGDETIKWHIRNLLAKLDAGNRKQLVSRARILGLLAADG